MQTKRETYNGWDILILPSNATWSFHCCPAGEDDTMTAITNNEAYHSPEIALEQAQRFVDRFAVRDKIDFHLEKLLESGTFEHSDYALITRLLGELLRL